jgi:hypothetical protein
MQCLDFHSIRDIRLYDLEKDVFFVAGKLAHSFFEEV